MSIADLIQAAEYIERRERGKYLMIQFWYQFNIKLSNRNGFCLEAEHGYATPLQHDLKRRSKSKKSQGSRYVEYSTNNNNYDITWV